MGEGSGCSCSQVVLQAQRLPRVLTVPHGMGGFCKEEEETLALVPDDADRYRISSHSCALYNPSDASSYLQLLPTGF